MLRRTILLASWLFTPVVHRPTPTAHLPAQDAPQRVDRGRFTAVYYPSDATLVQSLLDYAVRTDTFPGLPRPTQRVLLAVAPDLKRFREWAGPSAPEWGAAITFPESRRIVMQGRAAGNAAGDPREILRHELAHLALHEDLDDLPPRWFDEGYASFAAHEWRREDALSANVALALKGVPTFEELDADFGAGATTAENAYALAYRAVVDLAALDTARGLARLFENWKVQRNLDRAIRASYGMTLAGFEKDWQARTRRRYGALALASDLTLGGLVMLVIVLPLYFARRRREKERMAALLAADEAAERAARQSVLDILLAGDEGPDFRDKRSEAETS
ncbi:MAG TPA: hypothetical protein VN706_21800 [Gemmatimonadaceae bacterium]|nr:hypothetical protein [Gemmatimonadaceae bacterium]